MNKIVHECLKKAVFMVKRINYNLAKKLTATEDKTVFFETFQARKYACNPKALYEEMLANDEYRDFKFIWAVRDMQKYSYLNENRNTTIVRFESVRYFKELAKSKYWIINSKTRNFIKPKKDQIFLQTWHGTPLKKIGCDVTLSGNSVDSVKDIYKKYTLEGKKLTYMVSPSAFCSEKLISAFNLASLQKENCILELGYPRNTALFTAKEDSMNQIKKDLGIPLDKKVILYAPTFRDNQHQVGLGFVYKLGLDFEKLKRDLGEGYVVLFRAHYFVANAFDFDKYWGFVYNVSDLDDINDLYLVSDMLMTDYSSVFFDYANLKKPILFYMYDYDDYKNEIRDFYIDMEELPGEIYNDQNSLTQGITRTMNHFEYDIKYEAFNNKYNYLDGPMVSGNVLKAIIKM